MADSILIVDDNPAMIQVAAKALEGMAHLRFATSGPAALQQLRLAPVDLVLLDAEMPGMSGFEVCEAMMADSTLAHIPVVFVTGHDGMQVEIRGLESGAVDFIAKPVSVPLLLARVKTQLRVKHLTDALRHIANIDPLTELHNRRSFDQALEREWLRACRTGEPIGLISVDVDHFKRFNDRYGHPAGDACLRAIARTLRGVARRPADLAARCGGEEFALLLPETDQRGGAHVLRRLLQAIDDLAIPHADSPTASIVTVSLGLAHHDADSPGWVPPGAADRHADAPNRSLRPGAAQLVAAADAALYRAKQAGRAQGWRLPLHDADRSEAAALVARRLSPAALQGAL